MHQIVQSLRTGQIELVDSPCPAVRAGHLLIRSRKSLISVGTERMLLEFGKAGWLGKARAQPDKVRQVIDKIKSDGLLQAIESVKAKLDQPLPLGYCNQGTVVQAGADTNGFQVGDRVVSNGHHAEMVCVPKNLCAKVPDGVSDEAAAFTVVGAIGLQGIRFARPTLGESFVVTGLGLIGLLTVQLLRAHGCRVLGVDFDRQRLDLARQFGAEVVDLSRGEDAVAAATALSRGRGVDGVLITAATKSNEPVHEAAEMCRKRGRIVLVGVAGLQLSRADFYEKELSFQVSCSYGPGRYDPVYEQHGQDYPYGFVRWTVERNFQAVLDMMADGRLDTQRLVSHRFDFNEAAQAYQALGQSGGGTLGLLLDYPADEATRDEHLRRRTIAVPVATTKQPAANSSPRVGIIGTGAFACRTLIPALRNAHADLRAIVSQNGVTAGVAARRFRIPLATTDVDDLLASPDIDALVIATRHDSHADLVCRALTAGKHVYVEKPLAMNHDQADRIAATLETAVRTGPPPVLMVGFNRRFAPHIVRMTDVLRGAAEPKSLVITVNAGAIPCDSWVHDPLSGGGRIVGEACHFIDLARHLCGHPVTAVQATPLGGGGRQTGDNLTFTLRFADGSFAAVHYLARGHRGFPKERIEAFWDGKILQLDNFRRLRAYGCRGLKKMNAWKQDKGHHAAVTAFLEAVRDGTASPIPVDESMETTRASFDVVAAAQSGETIIYGGDNSPECQVRSRAA